MWGASGRDQLPSLEDRIVKRFMRDEASVDRLPKNLPCAASICRSRICALSANRSRR